jgi:hypothetical protein
METQTTNPISESDYTAQIADLMRVTEQRATRKELIRIMNLLLEWGVRLTPNQIEALVGDNLPK